ncbi:MAG: hypothetical protein AAB214_01650, partial [Fibrobacterota bacterium]
SGPDGFRLDASLPEIVEVVRLDGSQAEHFLATPGVAYGTDYPAGMYAVRTADGSRATFPRFAK